MLFNVTYETITPESAEHGDAADRGYLAENVSFRDALDLFDNHGHVEADRYPTTTDFPPRWFTAYGEMDPFSGETENRALHLPASITSSSAMRIARLVGCYGVK